MDVLPPPVGCLRYFRSVSPPRNLCTRAGIGSQARSRLIRGNLNYIFDERKSLLRFKYEHILKDCVIRLGSLPNRRWSMVSENEKESWRARLSISLGYCCASATCFARAGMLRHKCNAAYVRPANESVEREVITIHVSQLGYMGVIGACVSWRNDLSVVRVGEVFDSVDERQHLLEISILWLMQRFRVHIHVLEA